MLINPYQVVPGGPVVVHDISTGASGSNVFGANTTFRIVLPANYFTSAFTKIELTLYCGGGASVALTALYIGQQATSGDAYDFAATPTQILFAGSGSKTISSGTFASDITSVSLDRTKAIVIALDVSGGSDGGLNTGIGDFYQCGSAPKAATVDISGGSVNGSLKFFSRIRTFT
jgi:hypothetical protein